MSDVLECRVDGAKEGRAELPSDAVANFRLDDETNRLATSLFRDASSRGERAEDLKGTYESHGPRHALRRITLHPSPHPVARLKRVISSSSFVVCCQQR